LLKAVFFNEKGDEKETFTGLFENCEDPLSKLQYINYFIPQIKKFTEKMPEVKKKDLVFITIRQMINSALKSKGKFKFDIDYKKLDSNDIDFINNVILDFEKLPPVIRCAILFNDLKRFKSFSKIQSYSISVGSEDELTKSGESNTITYIISDASN
jgi:hypothetical protein